jgi:glycyl-tRNA synthetase
VSALERVAVDGVEHVGVTKTDVGRGAVEVLSGVLGEIVAELRADKNMRWEDPKLSFSRPVRWLLAKLGTTVVPVAASALRSGGTTRVHRMAPQPVIEVASAEGYLDLLAGHGITASIADRRLAIVSAAQKLAETAGGSIDVEGEAALLDEITNLVEEPNAILGGFASSYLELPQEILTTVMRKHQRYLPVRTAAGELLPHFVAVANGACDTDAVRAGNEAVLRARYEDASFFWRADLKVTPAAMKAELSRLAFEERLGSMTDRANRIALVAADLGSVLPEADQSTLTRAAALAKFDLGSQMVIELTSLAGVMAREYAIRAGEPSEVAQALFDMERPRSSADAPPVSLPGAVLALADRFDMLAGLFAVGAAPTGSSDPFGLRRAAAGVISILRAHPTLRSITLRRGLTAAAEHVRAQGIEVSSSTVDEVVEFVTRRFEQQLLDAGHDHRHVAAVVALPPATADETLAEIEHRVGDADFGTLVAALQRVRRIVPPDTAAGYDPARLTEPAEVGLHQALVKVTESLGAGAHSLAGFVASASDLTAPINTFFDDILVMAEDPAVRTARLGLLATIRDLAAPVLDWQALGTSFTTD